MAGTDPEIIWVGAASIRKGECVYPVLMAGPLNYGQSFKSTTGISHNPQ